MGTLKKDSKKPTMKVQDLEPQADPKGGALTPSKFQSKDMKGHNQSKDMLGHKMTEMESGGMDSIGSIGGMSKKPRR